MPSIYCPRCGAQAEGGYRFWGLSKPHCTACGWNVTLAIEATRNSRNELPWALPIIGVVFLVDIFGSKDRFAAIPMLLLFTGVAGIWISLQRKLNRLQEIQKSAAYPYPQTSALTALQAVKLIRESRLEQLRALPKPRIVVFKLVPRILSYLFPLSWVFGIVFVFTIFRERGLTPVAFSEWLPFLLMGVIWSGVCIVFIWNAIKDRRLLAEGEIAMGTVIHQRRSGRKHQTSRIYYEFRDSTGRKIQSDTTDDSRTLYEEMETPVFYSPLDPYKNIPLVCADCRLVER